MGSRADGRKNDDLRPVSIEVGCNRHAEGSALIRVGNTAVICTASVEDKVPAFLRGTGKGWVTGEYGMLPRATHVRTRRESSRGGPSGRVVEIQRLIGRSLRAVTALDRLGDTTMWIDCDVLQADGGTRTASITGGFVALALAFRRLADAGRIARMPLTDFVAAVSVGRLAGTNLLDLDYSEDSAADVDMNVVKTGRGLFVEVQGTAEHHPFEQTELDALLAQAGKGIRRLCRIQREALRGVYP